MRAKEFVINIPISISFNGDGDPELSVADQGQPEADNGQQDVFVSPQQQEIELQKGESGKESEVIDQIVSDDDEDRNKAGDHVGLMKYGTNQP